MSAPDLAGEAPRSLRQRNLYRAAIVISLPFLPVWLLLAMIVDGFPDFAREYWQELSAAYRASPKALKKGARV